MGYFTDKAFVCDVCGGLQWGNFSDEAVTKTCWKCLMLGKWDERRGRGIAREVETSPQAVK